MKIFKYFFYLLLVVVLGTATYIALLDGKFSTERNTTLIAPQKLAFTQINELKNWPAIWLADDSIPVIFGDKKQGENASINWHGERDNTTEISLTNTELKPTSYLKQKAISSKKPIGQTEYQIRWTFDQQNDSLEIAVEIKGRQDFWAKTINLIQRNTPGEVLDKKAKRSLKRLHHRLSKKMEDYSIDVEGLTKNKATPYIYLSFASKNDPGIISEKREKSLKTLKNYVADNNLKQNGKAFMVFTSMDKEQGNVTVSAALPLKNKIGPGDKTSNILLGALPRQRMVKSILKGDYKNIPKLWEATESYMYKNDLEEKTEEAAPFEVFVKRQTDSKNPADWITQLYIPVKERNEVTTDSSNLGI